MKNDVHGRTIAVRDGQLFDPFSVTAQDGAFRVATIAHALGNLCRYGGHTSRFYSVAEHCLLVESVIDLRLLCGPWNPGLRLALRREALVHDASEAYLIDLPAPFKRMPELEFYRLAEKRLESELRKWFGLAPIESATIKDLDVEIRGTERVWLFPDIDAWKTAEPIQGIECGTMSPTQARDAWLAKFSELWPEWRE